MAEDDATRAALEHLAARLEHLEGVLQANTQRLHAVERRLSLDSAPPPRARAEPRRPLYESIVDEREEAAATSSARVKETPPVAPENFGEEFSSREAGTPPSAPEPPRSAPPPRATVAGASRMAAGHKGRDLESVIGGSWFNWIGIIAFTFGVAFFLKYAFENQWIGPAGRVLVGAAAGLGILAAADRLRARGYRQYAYVLSGGGILILYLSIYAAFNFYQLIGQPFAFVLMALVTTAAVLLSVRHDALPIAVLGLIGGFLTPLLLSTGRDNQVGLFTYLALLDAGVLALAYFKRWRSLDVLSFAFTTLMFFGWLLVHYRSEEKLWPTIFFLTLFFLMFSALALAHNALPRRRSRWNDILIVIANATFYFGVTYSLLEGASYGRLLGSFALLVSAFFVLLFYVAWTRMREDRLLVYAYMGAAVTFFTMAVAIQADQHWVTIGWAAEGLMLTWVGLRAGESAARHAALFVFAVAVAHWLGWDASGLAYGAEAGFAPLLNRRALSCAALVGALLGAAWLYRRADAREVDEDEGALIGALLQMTGAALFGALLTLDVNEYFERRLSSIGPEGEPYPGRIESARQFSLTALWSFYGAGLLALGLARRMRALRYGALLLLAATALKVLLSDLAYYDAPWRAPFLNLTFGSFAALVVALWFVYRTYRKAPEIEGETLPVVSSIVIMANALVVVALSAEALGYFAQPVVDGATAADALARRDLRLARQLALSLVWAVYGGGLLLFGYVRNNRLLRVMGLLLLGLTTLKVFFLDLSALERVYRIISFIVLGAILLAVSYLYQQSQRRTDEANEDGEATTTETKEKVADEAG